MDRTSILGDTIDYTKELLERIKSLQQEIEADSNELNMGHIFKGGKSNEIFVRNTPKVIGFFVLSLVKNAPVSQIPKS